MDKQLFFRFNDKVSMQASCSKREINEIIMTLYAQAEVMGGALVYVNTLTFRVALYVNVAPNFKSPVLNTILLHLQNIRFLSARDLHLIFITRISLCWNLWNLNQAQVEIILYKL